jgi:hypothetical protein
MTSVLFGKTLPQEEMSQMSSAIGTEDLSPVAVSIKLLINGSFDLIIETGPSTMTVEFVTGPVQRGVAALTDINAGFIMIHVLSRPGSFRSFMNNNKFLKIS